MCGCPSRAPYWGPGLNLGICPGNRTCDPLLHRGVLRPLSHTSQSCFLLLVTEEPVVAPCCLPIVSELLDDFPGPSRCISSSYYYYPKMSLPLPSIPRFIT